MTGVNVSMRAPGAGLAIVIAGGALSAARRDALGCERRGEHAGRQHDEQRVDWRTIDAKHGHLSVSGRLSS